VLVRNPARIPKLGGRVDDVVVGEPLDDDALRRAVVNTEVAYFPLGLLDTDGNLARLLPDFARRFRDACIEAGVRRMVYLGPPRGLAAAGGACGPASYSAGAARSSKYSAISYAGSVSFWFLVG
jgi:hypothetical protein